MIIAKQRYSKQVAQGYGGWALQKRLSSSLRATVEVALMSSGMSKGVRS